MIDPGYIECVGDIVDDTDDVVGEVSSYNFSTRDVYAFNPIEELCSHGNTPSSFYELLSVFNVFGPIYVYPWVSTIECTLLDLDTTDGCLMAIQGRYPNSNAYSLSTKHVSPESGVNMSKVSAITTSPHGLSVACRLNNKRGISLAYACETDNDEDTISRVVACVACLSDIGTLCFKVSDYSNKLTRDVWRFLATTFFSMTLYKPAVLSCVKRGAVIVCSSRYLKRQDINVANVDSVLQTQIDVLEKHRLVALDSVARRVNNGSYDTSRYVSWCVGLI